MADGPTQQPPEQLPGQLTEGLPEQLRIRRAKRAALLAAGTEPYPVTVPRTRSLRQVRREHDGLPIDTATGQQVSVAGRVTFARNGGKLCFATLTEG